jgi:hypothetical protein
LNKLTLLFALLGTTFCLCGSVAGASDAKTTLMRDAAVNGKSIYLSDLLPESSPAALRVSAQEILVGKSPQPGSMRVLSSGEIVRLLNSGNLLSRVTVPEQIVVHRTGHLVTREEVAEAIRKTLSRNPDVSSIQIAPEEIRLSARVTTLAENPALRVTRMELDRSLREMKFWLVSEAEPSLLPFIATTQSKLQSGFEIEPQVNMARPAPQSEFRSASRSRAGFGGGRKNSPLAFGFRNRNANVLDRDFVRTRRSWTNCPRKNSANGKDSKCTRCWP